MYRQSPSTVSSTNSYKMQSYTSQTPPQTTHRQYPNVDTSTRIMNPHQIQPHQQYEQGVMSSGLGGYWKRAENGELVWCTTFNTDVSWQRDKRYSCILKNFNRCFNLFCRFGSLDRRKNKRLHKKTSTNVDPKSATISSTYVYHDCPEKVPVKAQQV